LYENKILNWKNILKKAHEFQNSKPFPYGYIENIINEEMYDKLCQTFPVENEIWHQVTDWSRSSIKRYFGDEQKNSLALDVENKSLSEEWNKLHHYLFSNECITKFSEYTGLKLSGLRQFAFINNHKGHYNMPHYHFEDSQKGDEHYQVTFLIYLTKGWINDVGGTYVCKNEDETSIIFEPKNLDNSMMGFAETPISWHGSKYITRDAIRHSIQFTYF
jgi:hypothetical protein